MINSIFELLNKYNIQKDDSILIGDSILNNQLVVKYHYLPENIDNPIKELNYTEEFNWIVDLQDKTNMAMLHLHAWEPVNYLLLAYHYTLNNDYIKKAVELIDDWYKHSLTASHKYLYYPHCVSDRSLVLSYLLELGDTGFCPRYMSELIEAHISYLSDDDNYVKFNHGTMMDRSLISLCMVTGDDDTLDFSVQRVCNNIFNTFTENMICVENSFTYTVFNLELIISTQKYLLDFRHKTIYDDFDLKMNQALDFLNTVMKPDGTLPLYGDGELISITSLKNTLLFKFYPNHTLFTRSVESNDTIKSHYYSEEGFLILKDKNFHFFIRAGDTVKNHKHADDLSFTLFHDYDIFVDPGTYSYDKGEVRNYLKSSYAHNSIVLNNENYNYLKSTNNEVYIDTFEEFEDFFYVRIVNKAYDFSIIKRSFYILKSDYSIIIVDDISTPFSVMNTQTFNLSPYFKESLTSSYVNNYTVRINNNLLIGSKEVDDVSLVYNDKTIYSEKFQQSESIPRIEFNKLERNGTFITVISKNIKNDILDNIEFNDALLKFSYMKTDYKHSLKLNKESINLDKYINIINNDDTYIVETYHSVYDSQEYAWYIYKDDIRVDIIWYQESPVFNYNFQESGVYRIRCFIRNLDNKDEKKEFSIKKNIKNLI